MIEYDQIDTLFLDAGNTLVSMNFAWIAEELRRLGFGAETESIRRAEAAARPTVSQQCAEGLAVESGQAFLMALAELLKRLQATQQLSESALHGLAAELAERIKIPGNDYRLWSWLMPAAEDALDELHALGLQLVVVSNSDGSVERALGELGLTSRLAAVFDSAIVGYEKPDPKIFEHALAESGAERNRTVHVGDMYYQDVEGARRAGLHGVLLDPFDDWDVSDCVRHRDLLELAQHIAAARR